MKCSRKSESVRRKRKVLNIFELGDGEQIYIRLDNGKKYLLNGDGCWRCGSTAECFGNMDGNELGVICEFNYFDEVRSLFLVLVKERVSKSVRWFGKEIGDKSCSLVDSLANTVSRLVDCVNVKESEC